MVVIRIGGTLGTCGLPAGVQQRQQQQSDEGVGGGPSTYRGGYKTSYAGGRGEGGGVGGKRAINISSWICAPHSPGV